MSGRIISLPLEGKRDKRKVLGEMAISLAGLGVMVSEMPS